MMEGTRKVSRRGEGWVISPQEQRPFDACCMMQHLPAGPYRDTIAFRRDHVADGPNQLGSVLSTAQETYRLPRSPEIRRISLSSDFLLEELKTGRMSVYLSIPLNAVSGGGSVAEDVVLLLIDMMMRVQKAPKPPILLAIDEFLPSAAGRDRGRSTRPAQLTVCGSGGGQTSSSSASVPGFVEPLIGG